MNKFAALVVLSSALGQAQNVNAWDHCFPEIGFCNIEGVAITGNNNRLGTTVFSFEHVGPVTFGQFVGALNPDGPLPFVIDEYTPDDSILVSIAPPGFPLYGDNAPNIPFQNLPFQDVPAIVAPNGAIGTLPHNSTVSATTRASGSGKVDYSLGEWLKANGTMVLRCRRDGTTRVRAAFSNLVRNGGVYSMWAFWAAPDAPLNVIPFGGSGVNVFSTDAGGRARLTLDLPYCALDEQDGQVLVAVQLDFHSDDGVTGAFPNLPFVEGRGPGIIAHSHLILSIRGERCDRIGNCVIRP